jgi:hypothetical protein
MRNKRISCSLVLFLLISLLVACSGATSSSGVRIHPTATPTSIMMNSPLIGTYVTTITRKDVAGHLEFYDPSSPSSTSMYLPGLWVLTFRNDGIWIAQGSTDLNNQYIGTGHYQVTPSQVTLVTDARCLEYYVPYYGSQAQSATYTWRIRGKTLVLQTAQDLCAPRKIVLSSHPWTSQS